MTFSTRAKRMGLAGCILAAATLRLTAQDAASEPKDFQELQKNGKPPRGLNLESQPPQYPREMVKAGLTGEVTVEFIVDQTGRVRNPVVVASNNPWFERPAITAVLKWRFTPGEIGGRKVATRLSQLIEFQLDDYGSASPWTVKDREAQKRLPPEMQWDQAPEPVKTAYPVYPFEALRSGQKGTTKLMFLIDKTGVVVEAKVAEATNPEMAQATLAMIDTWRFKPARKKDGTPVDTVLRMDYEFLPKGRGDVPVSDSAREILHLLEKEPAAITSWTELDQRVKPLSQRGPVYPLKLNKAGITGSATIEFFIDQQGDAQLPRIVSSTAPEFGYAAAQATATWRFEPPQKHGKPTTARAQITIDFAAPVPKPPVG